MYKKICSSVLIFMDYVLEIEQRLFKPLASYYTNKPNDLVFIELL